MTRTVLHVGMPRTGTKWLQAEVFPKHPDIEFHCLYDWPKLVGLSQHPPKDKVRVISCEHWTDWRGGWKRIEREVALLCDLFGPATRILMVTRKPAELVESVYRYSVQHGGAIRWDTFRKKFAAEHAGWELWENHKAVWQMHFHDFHHPTFDYLRGSPALFLNSIAQTVLEVRPFNGVNLTPTNTSLREPWLTVMQAVNCVSGTHDITQGRRPMGRLRRAITAANGWGR